MRLTLVSILSFSLFVCSACSSIKRHPVVYGIVAGSATGIAIGLATKPGKCPSIINGYPYSGTPPCPPPNWEPGAKSR